MKISIRHNVNEYRLNKKTEGSILFHDKVGKKVVQQPVRLYEGGVSTSAFNVSRSSVGRRAHLISVAAFPVAPPTLKEGS